MARDEVPAADFEFGAVAPGPQWPTQDLSAQCNSTRPKDRNRVQSAAVSNEKSNYLDSLSRDELIARATELGVVRPELMTRVELRDEIVRLTETDEHSRRKARGWLGVARDLVASVVEQRLNLPDAAELIRGLELHQSKNIPPVATVTLAEIYAAQGHLGRAVKLLDEVLLREPDHPAASSLRASLLEQKAASENARGGALTDEVEPPGTPPEAIVEDEPSAMDNGAVDALDAIEEPPIADATAPVDLGAPVASANDDVGPEADGSVEPAHLAAIAAPVDLGAPVASASDDVGPEADGSVEPAHLAAIAASVDLGAPVTSASDDVGPVSDGWVQPAHLAAIESAGSPAVADIAVENAAAKFDILAYRRRAATVGCHWFVRARTWQRQQSRNNGQWTLRVVRVAPTEGSLVPHQVDMPMASSTGEVLINDVQPEEEIRMALGWLAEGRFEPCVLGVEISGESANEACIAWAPLAGIDDPEPSVWLDFARQNLFMSAAGTGTGICC